MTRLLVVDDHPNNCRPLARMFRHAGADARYALSGPDALAAVAADPPDLILLDVMMPEMDGFEVLRRLRADRRYDAVAVIMYTAASDPTYGRRATDLGAQGLVVKGTPFDDLHAEVRRHLSGRPFA